MHPVRLEVTVEGEGFEALLANLRDRLTQHSIFVETDRPIALRTPVSVEVSYHTGETALRGGGSVADVRTEGNVGVLVEVEWEEASRSVVDRILTSDFTDSDLEPISWADALFSGGAVVAPNFVPDAIQEDISIDISEDDGAPSWLQPDDATADVEVPELADSGLVAAPVEPVEDATPLPQLAPLGPAGLPVFEPPPDQASLLAQDFQKLIDDTISEAGDAEAIVRGKKARTPSVPPSLVDDLAIAGAPATRAAQAETPRIPPPMPPPPPLPPAPPIAPIAPPSPIAPPAPVTSAPQAGPRSIRERARSASKLGPKGDVIIGIDLGTTYSCAAIVENGTARILATRRGRPTIPSVVYYDQSGRTFVGEGAIKKGETDAKRAIVGSKRLMGRPFHSPIVQEVREHFAYEIVQGENGEAAIRVNDRVVALEEVAAEILRELREAVTMQIEGRVNRAVITCPAYFNDRQRDAVRVAGELAGFHVERVLNEPTAAALHYGQGKRFDGRKLLVYDLGGGTFDVSLMEVTGQVYEVLATGGDSFLGGIDFDACIAEMLAEAFVEQEHIDPRTDHLAVARLLQYAERAKRDLSTMPTTLVQIDHLVVQPYAARSLIAPLKLARVEQAFAPLVDRTLEVVQEVCARAGVKLDDVHDILLVGGQTRTPLVQRKVAELFGRKPISSVHPDFAVALGAAQYAASLESFDNIVLIDALPMSIGIGLPGGRFKKIVPRDTRLPVKRKYTHHTTRDDQKSFDILVFQGEDDWVQHNEPLGMLHVPKLPKGPRGTVSVDIDLEINEECILKLSATETKTGKKIEAHFGTKDTPEELRSKLGLPAHPTHAELNRMKEEANRPKGVWRWLTGLFSS
jgi:molecular chaperone DnaK